jgi:quercetin dioxygenase-like cupin family protein
MAIKRLLIARLVGRVGEVLRERSITLMGRTPRLVLAAALTLGCCGTIALAGQGPNGTELPTAAQVTGVRPEVLLRAGVPGAPDEVLIVSRVTYEPGVHVGWHRHNSQVVFYILQGTMDVQDKGGAPFTLGSGQSLLIEPGMVHRHWNASTKQPLVFLEYVLVKKGEPSIVFLK